MECLAQDGHPPAHCAVLLRSRAQVRKGLALDLPLSPTGELPTTRELRQLADRLALKLDMYREASSAEERATLLLEQVGRTHTAFARAPVARVPLRSVPLISVRPDRRGR